MATENPQRKDQIQTTSWSYSAPGFRVGKTPFSTNLQGVDAEGQDIMDLAEQCQWMGDRQEAEGPQTKGSRERCGKCRFHFPGLRLWCVIGVFYSCLIQGQGQGHGPQGGAFCNVRRKQDDGSQRAPDLLPAAVGRSYPVRSEAGELQKKIAEQSRPPFQGADTKKGSMAAISHANARASSTRTITIRLRDPGHTGGHRHDPSPTATAHGGQGSRTECRNGSRRDSPGGDARHGQAACYDKGYEAGDRELRRTTSCQGAPTTDGQATTGPPTTSPLHDQCHARTHGAITECTGSGKRYSGAFHSYEDESSAPKWSLLQVGSGRAQESRCGAAKEHGHRGDFRLKHYAMSASSDSTVTGTPSVTTYTIMYTPPGCGAACEKRAYVSTSMTSTSGIHGTVSPSAILATMLGRAVVASTTSCSMSSSNALPRPLLVHRDDGTFVEMDVMESMSLMQTGTCLLAMSTLRGSGASWTDDFLTATGAMPPNAGDGDQQQDYDARWEWVAFSTNLPRPEDHADIWLFRVRLGMMRPIPDALVNFPVGVDAWEALDHLVTLWPDLAYHRRAIPWKAKVVHESVHRGVSIEEGVPAYIIVTNDEIDVGPFRDVLVEVQNHHNTKVEVDVAAWRVLSSVTYPTVLAQVGLSASCTLTHVCTANHNGRPMPTTVGIRLQEADFFMIEMLARQPAQLGSTTTNVGADDAASDGIASQAPTSPIESDHDHAGPVTYVIYRPRFRDTDSRACWIATDTRTSLISTHLERHWPDLHGRDYHTVRVHQSLQVDMPDAPGIQHGFLIADDDFAQRPGLRGTLVYLRLDKAQELYSAPLATRTSEYGLLHWAGILHACRQQNTVHCGVWINGHRLRGAESARLAHADYVKIALWMTDTPADALKAIAVDDYDPTRATYHDGSPYRTMDSDDSDDSEAGSRDAALSPGSPSGELPRADIYWIVMAVFGHIFGGVMLYIQQPPQKRRKRIVHGSMAMTTWLMIGLILTQHIRPVAILMLINTGRDAPMHYVSGNRHRLPPPGNPDNTGKMLGCLHRTPTGDALMQWMVTHIQTTTDKDKIWSNLRQLFTTLPQDEATEPPEFPFLPVESVDQPLRLELAKVLELNTCTEPACARNVTPGSEANCWPHNSMSLSLGSHLDDLDDLVIPWVSTSPPDLDDLPALHPELPLRLLRGQGEGPYDSIEIYTDGSYGDGKDNGIPSATWAFVVCGRPPDDDKIGLIDWYGDFTIDDPLEVQWIGAVQQHIREAESSALLWTSLYLLAHHRGLHVSIYSDALAVLNAAKGRWSINPEERIGLRLRAAFQLLERLKDDSELRCRHVKSHSGILGNELVDAVANAIRNGDLQPRPPPRHYATWMHGDPPQILRAHSLLDHYFRRDLPPIHGDAWIYEAPTVPSTSPCWLQTGEPSCPT